MHIPLKNLVLKTFQNTENYSNMLRFTRKPSSREPQSVLS